jgi:DNA mismatch repair protein MSH2
MLRHPGSQVVAVAQTFCEVWDTVGGILGELDLLAGFADLSVIAPTPYVRPRMLGASSNHLELLGSR